MEQTVTDIDGSNESLSFKNQIEHFTFYTFFGDLPTDVSPIENEKKHSQVTHLTSVPFYSTIVHNVYNANTNFRIDPIVWNFFIYASRSKEGGGAGCVLID